MWSIFRNIYDIIYSYHSSNKRVNKLHAFYNVTNFNLILTLKKVKETKKNLMLLWQDTVKVIDLISKLSIVIFS